MNAPASFSRDSKRLASDYTPNQHDILCGRSKSSLNHAGNQVFRETIFSNLDRYDAARTKLDKSLVVTSIVDLLRSKSPNGGFVRLEGNQWYEIGDQLAREKVGHALRDAIKTRNKREEKKKAEKQSSVETKRESLLRMQRQLFEESLMKVGESIEHVSVPPSLVTPEDENKKSAYNDINNDKDTAAVAAAFYDVDNVEKQVLEPPSVARQITLEGVHRKYQPSELVTSPIAKRRKAMGDGEFYDITSTLHHRQVSLEDAPAIPNFLTLDMMPEPSPVVGPGIRMQGDEVLQQTDAKTPPMCNRRQVSVDQTAIPFCPVQKQFPSSDEMQKPSIKFTFHDVEGDALDEYVVQRISNWAA